MLVPSKWNLERRVGKIFSCWETCRPYRLRYRKMMSAGTTDCSAGEVRDTIPVKLPDILDIKQLPFLLCEREYCMLSALLKYGPLILHPWVWLYILQSSLKHIPFLRYPATECNHRSPSVPFIWWFQQSLLFLSTAHLGGLVRVKCQCNFTLLLNCALGGFSRCILFENDAVNRSLQGFCQFCSVCSCNNSNAECPRQNRWPWYDIKGVQWSSSKTLPSSCPAALHWSALMAVDAWVLGKGAK